MSPDPIAVAECAQYLYRAGVALEKLAGNVELQTGAVTLLVGAGVPPPDAAVMVEHLAEVYAEGGD